MRERESERYRTLLKHAIVLPLGQTIIYLPKAGPRKAGDSIIESPALFPAGQHHEHPLGKKIDGVCLSEDLLIGVGTYYRCSYMTPKL